MKTKGNPIENFIKIINELKVENEQFKQQNQWLMEQFRLSEQIQYGFFSEQRNTDQLNLFNESKVLADPTIADAIMDRVIHNSYILALDSKTSMREVMAEKTIKDIEKNGTLT